MDGEMGGPKLSLGLVLWLSSGCLFATGQASSQEEALLLSSEQRLDHHLPAKKSATFVPPSARTLPTTTHVAAHPPKPLPTHHHHHHPTSTRGRKHTTTHPHSTHPHTTAISHTTHPHTTTVHHTTHLHTTHPHTTAVHHTTHPHTTAVHHTTHPHTTHPHTTAVHHTTHPHTSPTKAHSPSPTHQGNQTGSPHHTTAPPPTSHPPTAVPPPTQPPVVPLGNYTVHNGSAVCLRAEMGLLLHVRYRGEAKQQLWGAFPVQPDRTQVSGTCLNKTISLELRFPEGHILFIFKKNESGNTSYLSHLQASLKYQFPQAAEGSFSAENASLQAFVTHLGKSYQCRARTVVLAESFHLEALRERLQAFQLHGGAFGEAEVCPEQRRSIVLPIVVSVILCLLIVIVLVAFAVGRWRIHTGYQPL